MLLLKDELQAMVIEREETIVGLRKEVETLSAKLAAKDFVKEVSLWRRTHTMHTLCTACPPFTHHTGASACA